jgi:hypothetical protein
MKGSQMKKVLLLAVIGASLLYGNQMEHTTESLKMQQTELEQIKKEIAQLKSKEAEPGVLKYNTDKSYAIEEDIRKFLTKFYKNKSDRLKKYKIVSYDIQARIPYITIETEVERNSSLNDIRTNATSINILQIANMDGKLSMVYIKETNEV